MSAHDYWYNVVYTKGDFTWSMTTSSLDVAMWLLSGVDDDMRPDYVNVMSYHDEVVFGSIFERGDGVCYIGDATILKWVDPCWHYIDYVMSALVKDGELVEIYRDGKWLVDPPSVFVEV